MIEADKEQWKRSCEFLCSASTSSTSTVVLIVLQHDCLWCLKVGYTPNYSHLVGIMIINHWVMVFNIPIYRLVLSIIDCPPSVWACHRNGFGASFPFCPMDWQRPQSCKKRGTKNTIRFEPSWKILQYATIWLIWRVYICVYIYKIYTIYIHIHITVCIYSILYTHMICMYMYYTHVYCRYSFSVVVIIGIVDVL